MKNIISKSILVILLLGLWGCSSVQQNKALTQERKAEVRQAYHAGLNALMREPTLNPDVIWVLQQIEKIAPTEDLHTFIEDRIEKITEKHPALCSIIPDAPRAALPERLPSGFERYRVCLLAPFGTPPERAVSFVEAFVSTKESGYVLTHQFIVLVWAEQMGLELPDKVLDKKETLLKQIYREQLKDNLFTDLYAERAAMLLYYGKPKAKDASKWIDIIINAQQADGNWTSESSLITYDGQTSVLSLPKQHPTVLSLWAITSFLSFY